MSQTSLVGIGLYAVPEAARLTRISVPRIWRQSFKDVSADFDIPEKAVREAVAFQERLAA